METFKTSNSTNTFLYLKVVIKKDPVFAWSRVLLENHTEPIYVTHGGIGSIPKGEGWYKLGNINNFKGKRITVQTILNTANYDIRYYIVEDDDNFSPILHSEQYSVKPIEVEILNGNHSVSKIINIS